MKRSLKDRIDGRLLNAKGRLESAVGEVTGSDALKGDGARDEIAGTVQEALGKVEQVAENVEKSLLH